RRQRRGCDREAAVRPVLREALIAVVRLVHRLRDHQDRPAAAGPVKVPRAAAAPIINAMTVDVEDYFHVSVFDGHVPRRDWERMESRVCANTERLLEIFAGANLIGTFFVLGWVADRFPRIV